jgi:quinol monooxygenase YgiN
MIKATHAQKKLHEDKTIMILILGRLRIAPENHDRFLQMAQEVIPHERQKPGCVGFDIWRDVSDPNVFLMLERWQDQAALDAHLNSDDYARSEERLSALLDGEAEWEEYTV